MAEKSHARLVLEELLVALRQEHANFDLSTADGTDRVVIDAAEPPVISGPWVTLSSAWPILDAADTVTPLSQDRVEGTIRWWAFAPATEESTEVRAFAAMDLARDVKLAMKTAHATGDGTYPTLFHLESFKVNIDVASGDASVGDIPYGVAQGTITYSGFTEGGS